LGLRPPVILSLNTPALDALNEFQRTRTHFAVVCNDPQTVRRAILDGRPIPPDVHMAGIVTLEDIIERLLKEDIEDETDRGVRLGLQRAQEIERLKSFDFTQHPNAFPTKHSQLLLHSTSSSFSANVTNGSMSLPYYTPTHPNDPTDHPDLTTPSTPSSNNGNDNKILEKNYSPLVLALATKWLMKTKNHKQQQTKSKLKLNVNIQAFGANPSKYKKINSKK